MRSFLLREGFIIEACYRDKIMKLRNVIIKNFRSLVDINVPIGNTTVLVGENNSGKTAFLDALRMSFTRGTGRGVPFEEYDYYMSKLGDSPKTSDGILIELWFQEDLSDEWPESLVQALTDIIQTDPIKDTDSIGLRISCKYDALEKRFVPKWEFLALDGQPLGGKGANLNNLPRFFNYIRLFYLSAIRDPADEFSPRSQYWGRILRDLNISEEQSLLLNEEITKLNDTLLKADARLDNIKTALDNIQKVVMIGAGQSTSIQALPLKPWDLMSRSQVVIQGSDSEIQFPLFRHGQGVQSLAVLFLFQAYIEVFLKPTFQPETEAILALEEPESHLHPQASRALALNLIGISSQIIASSHSPYFIQEIPFSAIRMFRRYGPTSKVFYIKKYFFTELPNDPNVLKFCGDNKHKYDYHAGTSALTLKGKMEKSEFRSLVKIYPGKTDVHANLRRIYQESQLYLSDNELSDLETYAKRIRGEILFARAWLLCEGQSEYLLLRYFADLIGKPLDPMGIAVIDFQNNGSPGAFVSLAKVFDIPWIMICDNDSEGKKYMKQIENRSLSADEITKSVRLLPGEGTDLEKYLITNGFIDDYISILEKESNIHKLSDEKVIARQIKSEDDEDRQVLSKKDGTYYVIIHKQGHADDIVIQSDPRFKTLIEDIIVAELQRDKVRFATTLINTSKINKASAERVPDVFKKIIEDIIVLAV